MMLHKISVQLGRRIIIDGTLLLIIGLVVVCMLQGAKAQDIPNNETSATTATPQKQNRTGGDTVGTILDSIKKASKLSCYVCNSISNGACGEDTKDYAKMSCNDVGENGYLQQVYGALSIDDTGMPLNNFPPALSELAVKASPCTKNSTKSCALGWGSNGFADAFKANMPKNMGDGKYRFSSHTKDRYEKGFRSCRKMSVWTEVHRNGKEYKIMKTSPRVIRSCSFVDTASWGDKSCKYFSGKNVYTEICYCKGDDCNAANYLHVSQYLILMGCFLASGITMGRQIAN